VHYPQAMPLVLAGGRSGVQTLSGDHYRQLRPITRGAEGIRFAGHSGDGSLEAAEKRFSGRSTFI